MRIMRVFNELVFDGYITGTAPVYSESRFQDMLGFADQLSIGGYSAQVTGSSPKLTVDIEQSFDKERWQPRSTTPAINAMDLSLAPLETAVHGHDGDPAGPPANPRLAFVRLRITLTGTGTLSAQVRLWAAGRD
jgi:hypothetical protein